MEKRAEPVRNLATLGWRLPILPAGRTAPRKGRRRLRGFKDSFGF